MKPTLNFLLALAGTLFCALFFFWLLAQPAQAADPPTRYLLAFVLFKTSWVCFEVNRVTV